MLIEFCEFCDVKNHKSFEMKKRRNLIKNGNFLKFNVTRLLDYQFFIFNILLLFELWVPIKVTTVFDR